MKFSVYLISLITIYCLPMTYLQDLPKVPGSSGCVYFGSDVFYCNAPMVTVDELPKECTSFLYYDFSVNASLNVTFNFDDPGYTKQIQSMIDSGRPAFVFYGHEDVQSWADFLSCVKQNGDEIVQTEMTNLKTFLEPYANLSGLVIENITILPDTTNTAGITESFKIYLDDMRTSFPEYSLGLQLFGPPLALYYDQPNRTEWLNFTVLDPSIDFYILNVYFLNDCTEEFQVGGTVPINGSTNYTLEKLFNYVVGAGVPKEKIYILYKIGPMAIDPSLSWCDLTNTKVCESQSLDGYCVDNTQSYYDKGLYTKNNAAGFIALNIDLSDDPTGCCQCGPYPGFYDMLAGFNGYVTIAYDTIPYGPFSLLRLRTFYLLILSATLPLFKIVKICSIIYFRK